MISYTLEHQYAKGKWSKLGKPSYPTIQAAYADAQNYDEDGFVHPAMWRIRDSDGKLHKIGGSSASAP